MGAEAEAAGRPSSKYADPPTRQLPWAPADQATRRRAAIIGDAPRAPEAAGVAQDALPSFGDASLGQLATGRCPVHVLGHLVARRGRSRERLRRCVTRYRNDVVVCASIEDVAAAARERVYHTEAECPAERVGRGLFLRAHGAGRGLGAEPAADGVLTAEPRQTIHGLPGGDGFFAACRGRSWRTAAGRAELGCDGCYGNCNIQALSQDRVIEEDVAALCGDVPGTCGSATWASTWASFGLRAVSLSGARVQRAHDDVAHRARSQASRAERGAVPRSTKTRRRAAPSR